MNVLRITATVDELATVRQFIREQAAQAGADPGAVPDVVQAVDEFVTNSIIHGYRGRDGSVEVEVDRAGTSLIVRLRDQAPPFDPTQLRAPNTNAPLDERPLGGMGILLARDMVDSVTHQHTEAGNELTLVKDCISQQGGGRC